MNARFICVKLLAAIALAILSPCAWAQDGFKGALSQATFTAPFEQHLVIADLDDDKKPDGAVLLDSGWLHNGSFKIQLHLTDRPNAELTFESTQKSLTLRALDIDNDGDIDLVVEEAVGHKPLYVWINEGHGDFYKGRVEDFPSLASRGDEQVQSPPNQHDALALCMPSQRGFETTVLTTPLLSRPPSTNESQAVLADSSLASHTRSPNSSRAPPLS